MNPDREVIALPTSAVGTGFRGWLFFLLLVFVPLAVIFTDGLLRARLAHRSAASWAAALNLSGPAFWPSGTPQRHPELSGPGSDVRFSPWLPLTPDLQSRLSTRNATGGGAAK